MNPYKVIVTCGRCESTMALTVAAEDGLGATSRVLSDLADLGWSISESRVLSGDDNHFTDNGVDLCPECRTDR